MIPFSAPATGLALHSCVELFKSASILETKIKLSEVEIKQSPAFTFPPLFSVQKTAEKIQQFLNQSRAIRTLSPGRFAFNLSRFNEIHFASEGLSPFEHEQVLKLISTPYFKRLLASVPALFRNRYFEVTVDSSNDKDISVVPLLAVDLNIPARSHLFTGFAQTKTDKIRPFKGPSNDPAEVVRKDLLSQRLTQDTFATCD